MRGVVTVWYVTGNKNRLSHQCRFCFGGIYFFLPNATWKAEAFGPIYFEPIGHARLRTRTKIKCQENTGVSCTCSLLSGNNQIEVNQLISLFVCYTFQMELIIKKNITACFCDPAKVKKLLTFNDKTSVQPGEITTPLCSADTNTTAKVMEKLILELDIGELIKTVSDNI